ncbi:MAG: UDP-glucose/GDP-mannose dehydrogenase family protein [Christensenella sp.]|nr:UDP-glucose/GDP-mannose dehydrogenase family protein [Christensenella sp.]
MNTYNVAVAGTGYVGLVAGVCLAEKGQNVICVDVDEEKIKSMKAGVSPIYEDGLEELMRKNYSAGKIDYTTDYAAAYKSADVIIIGVGTPEMPDGSANLSFVSTVARQIAESVERDCVVVIKSTVPIGTNDRIERFIRNYLVHNVKIEVASNPEFLAQGKAVHDMLEPICIVIGTESEHAARVLTEIYEPFGKEIVSVNRCTAEMIKYAANAFLALKISYINDIANLCDIFGADIEKVAYGMGFDPGISRRFLSAGIGYGGSCFPKDTKSLCYIAAEHGYPLHTVKAAVDVNTNQRLLLLNKAKKRIISFDKMKVAILGLTFKPGTDDLREAPSLYNIPLLLEGGADIYAYDPVGEDNFKKRYPEGKSSRGYIRYTDNAIDAIRNADVCFIFTEWGEIKKVTPETFKKYMKVALVYDGRNIYDVFDMKNAGVEYYSVGRDGLVK